MTTGVRQTSKQEEFYSFNPGEDIRERSAGSQEVIFGSLLFLPFESFGSISFSVSVAFTLIVGSLV